MNNMILPPPRPPVSEIRYDLDSDVGQLDLISCHRLIQLTAKWQARNAAARIARLRAETDRYFGRGV
jgi:hypothetical protein